jgi:uroporphyrinogen decarboxylase
MFTMVRFPQVVYPQHSSPYFSHHVVTEPKILDSLELPDPTDPRISIYEKALRQMVEEAGPYVPISLLVRSPFTCASNLRGTEELLRDTYYRPEFAHRLIAFALEATLRVVRHLAPIGITFSTSDPVASGSLLSPKHYREFAAPYEQTLIRELNQLGRYPALLHICGDTHKVWGQMADTGAGFLSLDDVVKLGDAVQEVGSRVTLVGNVRPTESMYLGTPEVVVQDALHCFEQAGTSPKGFVLAVGCGLPIGTRPENVEALVATARRLRPPSRAAQPQPSS